MRWGAIVRGEDRGLGILCWEVATALEPDATLGIDMGPWARGFPLHSDRYPADTRWLRFDGEAPRGEHLDLATVLDWAVGADLDVVWSAETFYDWRIPQALRGLGIATVLHTMPEFHRPEAGACTRVWLPTPWRAEHHPGAQLVPIPVNTDRYRPEDYAASPYDPGPLRIIHPAGHRAAMDRNGTLLLLDALRWLTQPIHVTLRTQDTDMPHPNGLPACVTAEVITSSAGDWWTQYGGHHLAVIPRRYGGLCLPAQEAMGAGLGLVMPATSPNDWWPAKLIEASRGPAIRTPAGEIPTATVLVRRLAEQLDRLARHRDEVHALQASAVLWAAAASWENQEDAWRAGLADAVEALA